MTPSRYLAWLQAQTGYIDILNRRIPIQDVYIDLVTTEGEPLEQTLRYSRLLIRGDAGSGKTTFLRRIGYEKAKGATEELPLLIRLADLSKHLQQLPLFLAQVSREQDWGLDHAFFHRQMTEGSALVLLDGLDEATEQTARLLESTALAYPKTRFVVTCRPNSMTLGGFHEVTVAELDRQDFERILEGWTPVLNIGEPVFRTLRARPEFCDVARNPAILTTLAIAHWHDERGAPVLRADIHEAIVACLNRADEGSACFRHPLFRNFIAARTCADLPEDERDGLLLRDRRIYQPEWRDTLRVLGGLLIRHGADSVDGLVSAILDAGAETDRIRCVGLLGHLLRDLAPLRYEPRDRRFRQFVEQALAVFEPAAERIDIMTRVDAAEAVGLGGDPRLRSDHWVPIPACTFSRTDGRKTEEVELSAYCIARFPVTVEEYAGFVQAAAPEPPEDWDEQQLHRNRPVVGLGWDEAAAYCAWAECRLATEAEWERAARGTSWAIYPWGDELPDVSRANFKETGIGAPTPVGLFPAGRSPEGIDDLIGNVWEWVEDWYAPYRPGHNRNPRGPAGGEFKVLRGNSWRDRAKSLGTAATRAWEDPATRDDHVGFRCVREPLQ